MDYNARYYSPVLGRFISPDTMVPNPAAPASFNRYAYAHNNPLKHRDSSGHALETVWDVANVIIGVGSLGYNLSQGNYVDAAIDTVGLVVDVAATAIPFVPGGAGAAIKAFRAADKVGDMMDAAKTINGASNVVQGANQVGNGLGAAKQVENTVDTANDLDNTADTAKQLENSTDAAGAACSFSADTLVTTEEGLEAISELIVGDRVLAYDELLKLTGLYTVTAVWLHQDPVVLYLTIDGEIIETTPNHPFYTDKNEWVFAELLQVGQRVRRSSGSYGVVESLEFVTQLQLMYNLTVEQAHTYFVGIGRWLVHNDNCFELPKTVRSARGAAGDFSREGYGYRIDTNPGAVSPGEGGFHVHIFRDGNEIAKVNGRGGFAESHGGRKLLKPSELPKDVRNQLNRLIEHIQKNLE